MHIHAIHIEGFRCLEDVQLDLQDLTILIGQNGAGKSTLLHALRFFFDDAALVAADLTQGSETVTASVAITFANLSPADRDAFGQYATGSQMVLRRIWRDGSSHVTGKSLRYAPFQPIKETDGRGLARAYSEFASHNPTLGLPAATGKDEALAAMQRWEMEHPDDCEGYDDDASHLFGLKSVAQAKLASRFKFIFVPGIQNAADEVVERKGTILDRLLSAIAEQRQRDHEALKTLEENATEQYEKIVGTATRALDELAGGLEGHFRRYVPSASIKFRPIPARLTVTAPAVEVHAGEVTENTGLTPVWLSPGVSRFHAA